jgi:hypothetical protein
MLNQGKGLGIRTAASLPFAAWTLVITMCFPAGCGGSSTSKPDTGYGAMQPVPATINCVDLCTREGDCVEHLCNEDTNSTRYTGYGRALILECEASCTDDALRSRTVAVPNAWPCLFQSSCRMSLGEDVCNADASYTCR